jgi:hypothetical protein
MEIRPPYPNFKFNSFTLTYGNKASERSLNLAVTNGQHSIWRSPKTREAVTNIKAVSSNSMKRGINIHSTKIIERSTEGNAPEIR